VKLFLDTSSLLAACGSAAGASREIFRLAPQNHWLLLTTSYVLREVEGNLPHLPSSAQSAWSHLHSQLQQCADILTLDRPVVFAASKDRPVLLSAFAWADVLLTLDRHDFGALMNAPFYGLRVRTPAAFLQDERVAGRLLQP
jgi:hypothetical protein